MSVSTIRIGVLEGTSASEITKKKGFRAHCVAGFGFSQFMRTPSALPLYHGLSEVAGLGHSSTAGKTIVLGNTTYVFFEQRAGRPPFAHNCL